MTIRSNLGTGPIDVLAADTVIYQQAAEVDRYLVSGLNVYNDTGASVTIDFYISPDTTSASGDKVDSITLSAGNEQDINGIVGQGYTSLNVIAVGSAVGVNCSMTYTSYDGGD